MWDIDIQKSTAEREFLEYLHGYPGEPEWLSALLYGGKTHQEPEITEMKQMLVSLRIHVRVLYEKQKSLTNKFEASEHFAETRFEQLIDKDKEIQELQLQINDLRRQTELEQLRLNLSLTDAKHAADKEIIELKNVVEKAAAVSENEKRRLERALFDSKQEITQLQARLKESVQETAAVTENFKNFYEDYLKLEEDLSIIEKELIPVQMQFQELAQAMNLHPEELHYRLNELKKALRSNENPGNLKELLVKTLMTADKDEVTPMDSQVAPPSSGGSSGSASFNVPQVKSDSSREIEQSDPSCPFSQKFFPEQLDNSSHKEGEKKVEQDKGRVVWSKLGFKIPKLPLRPRKFRN